MAARGGPVHVVTTTRRYKGRVYTTHLLRRSFREDGKVRNETLGNLSHLPDTLVDMIRRGLEAMISKRSDAGTNASRSSPPGRTATLPPCCARCAGSTSRACSARGRVAKLT